jgi:hypothetical protein
MRNSVILFVVLTLFLLQPASITWAQTISSQKGLTTAIFPTYMGKITIYLPDDIRPGEAVSGSIIIEPSGKSEKQKMENFRVMLDAELQMEQLVIPFKKIKLVPSKPVNFDWLVPEDRKLTMPIKLNQPGVNNNLQLPYRFIIPETNQENKEECKAPSHIMAGNPVRITGSFDGNAENTKCHLDGKKLEVLAESPRQCIMQFPSDVSGPKSLLIKDGNTGTEKVCEIRTSGVVLDVNAGKLNLRKGEKTFIDVKVSGLGSLGNDTALLSLTNKTLEIVKLLPADFIAVPLTASEVTSGIFSRRFDVQSLQTGSFSVDVQLNLPGSEEKNPAYGFDLRELKNAGGYPGSYGYKGDEPCSPEGATIKWRWHKTFACEIDDRAVLPCGHTKASSEVLEKIKELLEEAELDKATDIAEKMSKAFSTSKTFSYSIHVIRKWVDYDIEYRCVNGKWQPTGGVYVKHGTDDLGWHSVKNLSTDCWLTFDSPAAEKEFEAAIELALRNACK